MLLHKWSGNKKARAHPAAPWQHMKYLFTLMGLTEIYSSLSTSLLGCLMFPPLNTIDRAPNILDAHPSEL